MKKRVLATILTLASVMSVAACGKKESEETKKKKSKTEKTTAVDEDETEERRENLLEERQNLAFNDKYAEWQTASPKFTVNEKQVL